MTKASPLSSNIQNLSIEQLDKILQKAAYRGLNVHHLAKANLTGEIRFNKDANTISIGEVNVNLGALQKKRGFSFRRCFCLFIRDKKTKEVDAKMIKFLAMKVHDAIQPKITPSKPVITPTIPAPIAKEPIQEEVVDEKILAFRKAQALVNKASLQEIYKNNDTAILIGSEQAQAREPTTKVSEEELEQAKRLLETEEAKRFFEEEKARTQEKLALINKNQDTATLL